jgi:dihydrofolate reductase (trimethoprim resistance protein)
MSDKMREALSDFASLMVDEVIAKVRIQLDAGEGLSVVDQRALLEQLIVERKRALAAIPTTDATFSLGERVEKISGSSWRGTIVGTYSTSLTPEGYAVESEREPGSVQIYPAKALRLAAAPEPPLSTDIQTGDGALQESGGSLKPEPPK